MEKAQQSPTDPQAVRVAADGSRVVFLRPTHRASTLWCYELSSGTEQLISDQRDPSGAGITGYAIDAAARTAGFTIGGRLHRADLYTGEVVALPTSGPASDPRPDPAGQRIGYLSGGGLHVIDESGADTLLAGEPDPAYGGNPRVVWGHPEPGAARQFGLTRGWWWAPDGRSVLATRVDRSRPEPEISLHLLDLAGGWVDVHWDRETYPYLVSVGWSEHRDPLIAVLRRPQQHGLVLAVDARTGETQVHAELADPRWVEPIPGTPCHLADGRVLVGGELAHDGYDARCLFADGTLLTPPSLYVRRVLGRLAGTGEVVVEGSAGEPSEQHLFRATTSVGSAGIDAGRLTTTAGWHRGAVGGDTVAIGSQSLGHPGTRWTVWRGGEVVGTLRADPAPAAGPRPALQRVTDRQLPTGVLYPTGHLAGRRLPVLIDAAGLAQGVRAARADWLPRQQWADSGFAVVSIDHRGTPGVAPSFEKVVHRRLADLALADLADALAALTGKHPDFALGQVAIRGVGVGGWLAALAVLRRPDLFRVGVAVDPVLDWATYDPTVATRYLGPHHDAPDIYQRHSLAAAADEAAGLTTDGRLPPLLVVPSPDDIDAATAALPTATVRPRLSDREQLAWLRAQVGLPGG